MTGRGRVVESVYIQYVDVRTSRSYKIGYSTLWGGSVVCNPAVVFMYGDLPEDKISTNCLYTLLATRPLLVIDFYVVLSIPQSRSMRDVTLWEALHGIIPDIPVVPRY